MPFFGLGNFPQRFLLGFTILIASTLVLCFIKIVWMRRRLHRMLWLAAARHRRHIENGETAVQQCPRDAAHLFGIRALEAGFCGGVTQAEHVPRQSSVMRLFHLNPSEQVWGNSYRDTHIKTRRDDTGVIRHQRKRKTSRSVRRAGFKKLLGNTHIPGKDLLYSVDGSLSERETQLSHEHSYQKHSRHYSSSVAKPKPAYLRMRFKKPCGGYRTRSEPRTLQRAYQSLLNYKHNICRLHHHDIEFSSMERFSTTWKVKLLPDDCHERGSTTFPDDIQVRSRKSFLVDVFTPLSQTERLSPYKWGYRIEGSLDKLQDENLRGFHAIPRHSFVALNDEELTMPQLRGYSFSNSNFCRHRGELEPTVAQDVLLGSS